MSDLLAVVPVRAGALPAGGAEVVAEAGGRVLLVGEGASDAARQLQGISTEVRTWTTPGFAPGEWAARLAPLLADERIVLLPASPDGRDLAPRLAAQLERPLLAGVMELDGDTATTIRYGGRVLAEHALAGPVVATLQPGVRGVDHDPGVTSAAAATATAGANGSAGGPVAAEIEPPVLSDTTDRPPQDVTLEELLPPDVSTMDLSEAPRILGGGAGLESAERFGELARVAARLGASMGATRVITDRGWLDHTRQIGTTGVVVDPRLYLAFGISGAVQHTAGLGHPDHIISINTDQHCPMMELADLAIVADANATLDALAARLDGAARLDQAGRHDPVGADVEVGTAHVEPGGSTDV